MLVLTRKEAQSVVFPNSGIVVHVLNIKGRSIKLGFEAPKDIEVLRGELLTEASQTALAKSSEENQANALGDQVHDLKNRLNTITLAIHAYNELKLRGHYIQADQVFNELLVGLADSQTSASTRPASQVLESAEFYATAQHADLPEAGSLAEKASQSDATKKPKPLRLLVVDDDANERELLAGLLEMKGCQCMTAASGNEALEVIENSENFDFALLDMHMPDRDGASTLKAIRADDRFAKLKVFSVSSTSPSECGTRLGGDGFDGWLPKPLNPATLWNHLQESLRREDSAV